MKKISVLLFLCGFIFSCNNDLQRIETTYTNGNLKEIYYINSKGEKEGKDYEFYENNKLKNVFNYKNGRFEGKAYLFDKNGLLRRIRKYKNHHLVDTLFQFDNNGSLLSKVIYGNNEDTLKLSWFYPNRKLSSEQSVLKMFSYFEDGPNSYISYNSEGKIYKDSSHCVFIRYLNNQGTKIGLTLNEDLYWLDNSYIKDYVEIFVLNDFNFGTDWRKRILRRIMFPNWNNLIITLNETDYINGKVNLLIEGNQKSKSKSKEYKSRTFEVQLFKGDKSRWHNVHPIY